MKRRKVSTTLVADLEAACRASDDAPTRCQNCGKIAPARELRPLPDVLARVAPGEVMPAGECRECGAVAHLAVDRYTGLRNAVLYALQFNPAAWRASGDVIRKRLAGALDAAPSFTDPRAAPAGKRPA